MKGGKIVTTFTLFWKITKDLPIQEKLLNLSKNSNICGVLNCPILIPYSPAQQ